MTTGLVIRGRDRFHSEIREAHRLGCKLEVKTEPAALGTSTAYARVTPTTAKARHHLAAAADADGSPGRQAIEVRQTYTSPHEALDAIAAAATRALDIARTALA